MIYDNPATAWLWRSFLLAAVAAILLGVGQAVGMI